MGMWQGQREGVIQLDRLRHKVFRTRLTSVSQPILGLGKGRNSVKVGPGELHGISRALVFNSQPHLLSVEANRDCGKVFCAHLIHPSYDRSIDVSSNRTLENSSLFAESMMLGLKMAWEPMPIDLPLQVVWSSKPQCLCAVVSTYI